MALFNVRTWAPPEKWRPIQIQLRKDPSKIFDDIIKLIGVNSSGLPGQVVLTDDFQERR
jgi:hypothetical protein